MPIIAIAVMMACWVSSPVRAQNPAPDTTSLTDTASLREYMDKFVMDDMRDLRVPGAVVAIVYSRQVVLLRGYGVSNTDRKTPVDPHRTIFRAGSVTKPFTAAAIMQLVEQGKIDPNADVNRFLRDVKIPVGFGKPVTTSDLLTHTAGFDVALAGTAARTENEVEPLGRYLTEHLPPRVRAPGETIAYSNHGFTLLGHVVEQLSGESYSQYLKRHVLDPLGMTSSTMQLTPDVEARTATPYEPRAAGYRIAPPLHPNISPAASLNTTAADMTHFMIAQLNGGLFNGKRVLAQSSVREMQATHFRQDPRMPGIAWGFFESSWHNRRIVFHSGGIRGFMSAVYLLPDDSIGLFVANNGYSGGLVFDVLFHLMNRYLPASPMQTQLNPADVQRLRKYAGFYREANHPVSNLEKAGGLRNPALEIRVTDSGAVTAFGVQFVESAPGFFHERKGWETLAFLGDKAGNVTGVVTTYPFPGTQTWNRIPFIETSVPSQIVMIWTLLLSIGILIRPPRIQPDARWSRTGASPPSAMVDWSRMTALIVRGVAAAQLSFLLLMWAGARTEGGMLYGVPWPMDAAGLIAVVGAVTVVMLIVRIILALLHADWPRIKLAPVIVIALSSTLFIVVQHFWNLLGIHH